MAPYVPISSPILTFLRTSRANKKHSHQTRTCPALNINSKAMANSFSGLCRESKSYPNPARPMTSKVVFPKSREISILWPLSEVGLEVEVEVELRTVCRTSRSYQPKRKPKSVRSSNISLEGKRGSKTGENGNSPDTPCRKRSEDDDP